MPHDIRTVVIGLLSDYKRLEREIAVLRYEMLHSRHITDNEMIEALNYAHGSSEGHTTGHISNKTMHIALNYQETAEQARADSKNDMLKELRALEEKKERLEYYVSLLEDRQSTVIRLTYFEGCSRDNVAEQLSLSSRTVRDIRNAAVNALAEMYSYTANLH